MNQPFRPKRNAHRVEVRCSGDDGRCGELIAELCVSKTSITGTQPSRRGSETRTVSVPIDFDGEVLLAPRCFEHSKRTADGRWRLALWAVPAEKFRDYCEEAMKGKRVRMPWSPWDDGNRPAYDAE